MVHCWLDMLWYTVIDVSASNFQVHYFLVLVGLVLLYLQLPCADFSTFVGASVWIFQEY